MHEDSAPPLTKTIELLARNAGKSVTRWCFARRCNGNHQSRTGERSW